MRKRFLTIPINETGIEECNVGVENSENMVVIELPESEFDYLAENGFFNQINDSCQLLIDDFESEEITNDDLIKCESILKSVKNDTPMFYDGLKKAIDYKTKLILDF